MKERAEMTNTPLVSVIIPVYKVEKYLDRCVSSVLNQTYKNLEIILVDDGSPDNCPFLCDQYAEKNSNIIVVHKENGGLSSARNAGLARANGQYVAFLDSDDWLATDAYAYMVQSILGNNADVADIRIVQVKDENDVVADVDENISVYEGNDILWHYLYRGLNERNGAPYSVCRKLYNRELFRGDTQWFVEGIVNEDICFNYRILKKANRIVVSNRIKYFYFQGNESITTGKCKQRDLDLLAVSEELLELTKETKNEKIIELAKMKQARSDFSILARIVLYGTDETIRDEASLTKKLCKRLRGNMLLIWRSPMPIS